METLNLNVNLENLTAEERDNLMKLVKKSGKKSKVWKPSRQYWTINGCVFQDNWINSDVDNTRYESGNCFETREEAEEELTRRKIITKWKRLSIEAGEGENEWAPDNGEWNKHWYVFYDNGTKDVDVRCNYLYNTGRVYYPTKESLLAAIQELGEDNVKRYILRVRD